MTLQYIGFLLLLMMVINFAKKSFKKKLGL